MVPERGVGVPQAPAGPALPDPVIEVLGDDEVLEVVVDGSLVVLEQRVGVSQAVAGLGFHGSILQLPRQLQRPPDTNKTHTHTHKTCDTVQTIKKKSFSEVMPRPTCSAPQLLQTPPGR